MKHELNVCVKDAHVFDSHGFVRGKEGSESALSQGVPQVDGRRTYASRGTSLVVATAVSLSLLGLPAAAIADDDTDKSGKADVEKTQVVYAKADASGDEEGVYVVNMFENKGKKTKEVEDSGSYQSVKNLSDEQGVSSSGTSTFKVSSGDPFLYQGDLSSSTELPWKVSVSYKLDGKKVSADQLAGASGSLEMKLKIKVNEAYSGDYADNYLLQATGLFDNKQVSSLSAKDSTKAQSGDSTQVGYMVFPGKNASYTVKAKVKDFEFAGWTVVGVPLSLALSLDDDDFAGNTGDLDSLETAIAKINDGAGSLSSGSKSLAKGASSADEGASALASGTDKLSTGASSLSTSASSLSDGASELSEGTKSLASGASALSGKLDDLNTASEKLEKGSGSYSESLSSQSKALDSKAKSVDVESAQKAYEKASENYVKAFSAAFAQAYAQTGSKEKAQSAAEKAASSERATMESKLKALVEAQATKTASESASEALNEALKGYQQVDSGISSLSEASGKIATAGESLSNAASKVDKGSSSLSDGASRLSSGAESLASASDEVSSGADSLATGVGSLSDGADKLADGAESLSDGTSKAAEETTGLSKKMIDKVRDQLEERLDPDYDPVDFVDDSNKVESVQFVMKTGEIEVPDEDDSSADDEDQQKTFWQKLLALFGL